MIFLLAMVATVLIVPLLYGQDPDATDLARTLESPSGDHVLGTDTLGRDILARLLSGGQVTFYAAAVATTIATLIGVPTGLLAGYLGGIANALLSRLNDALMSIPPLLLAFAIVGVWGPGLTNAMVAVGIVVSPRMFRIARTAASEVKSSPYIEASRASGCSTPRLLWRHVLPNSSGPLLIQLSFTLGLAIIAEASLSFLGLGVQLPQASWGKMTYDAYLRITTTAWGVFPPAVAITATIVAFSLLGDALRDALGRETGEQ